MHKLNVSCKTHATIECAVAVRAREGVFTGVVENVRTQLRCLNERLPAVGTAVWFDTGVCTHVSIQCFLRSESSFTLKLNSNKINCL